MFLPPFGAFDCEICKMFKGEEKYWEALRRRKTALKEVKEVEPKFEKERGRVEQV